MSSKLQVSVSVTPTETVAMDDSGNTLTGIHSRVDRVLSGYNEQTPGGDTTTYWKYNSAYTLTSDTSTTLATILGIGSTCTFLFVKLTTLGTGCTEVRFRNSTTNIARMTEVNQCICIPNAYLTGTDFNLYAVSGGAVVEILCINEP